MKEQAAITYKEKDKAVKRGARNDKRLYIEDLAKGAEQAEARGQMTTIYRIPKKLCAKTSKDAAPIKDKNGKVLTSEKEQAKRCVQHFIEVLIQDSRSNTDARPA